MPMFMSKTGAPAEKNAFIEAISLFTPLFQPKRETPSETNQLKFAYKNTKTQNLGEINKTAKLSALLK